jgi:hypothetical protein
MMRAVKYRWLVVAFALAAASMFATAAVAGHWWSIGDIDIGPFGSRRCLGDDCATAYIGASAHWLRFGIATWAACLIAALVLVITAAGVAARRVPKLAARTSLVAIGTALAVGGAFIVQRPSLPGVATEHGLFVFAGAIVVGAIAALIVTRARPPAPDQ